MKKTLVTLLALVLIGNFATAQSKKKVAGKLDKKTYTCDVTPEGKKKSAPDELKFTGGTFQCKTLTDDGFRTSEYTTTVDSNTSPPSISFTCNAKDDKDDVFAWTGKITGDDIEGKATLTNKKGKVKSLILIAVL